jgi:hypothetical protein
MEGSFGHDQQGALLNPLKRQLRKLQQISCHARNFPREPRRRMFCKAFRFMAVLVFLSLMAELFPTT